MTSLQAQLLTSTAVDRVLLGFDVIEAKMAADSSVKIRVGATPWRDAPGRWSGGSFTFSPALVVLRGQTLEVRLNEFAAAAVRPRLVERRRSDQ